MHRESIDRDAYIYTLGVSVIVSTIQQAPLAITAELLFHGTTHSQFILFPYWQLLELSLRQMKCRKEIFVAQVVLLPKKVNIEFAFLHALQGAKTKSGRIIRSWCRRVGFHRL